MTEDVNRPDWGLGELLEAWRDATVDDLHVAIPGRVESYDASTHKADVTPMVRRSLTAEDGSSVSELLPTLRSVPVLHLRGAGFFVHVPVSAGDFVLLLVLDRDVSRFLQTGAVSETPDTRTHHLAHAIAIPGLYPNAQALPSGFDEGASSGDMSLGKEGGPTLAFLAGGEIAAGGLKALAEEPNLDTHLSAIAAGLDALAARIALEHGGSTTETNYGAAAKATLDGTNPIATSILKAD